MQIVVAGGSGLLGASLTRRLRRDGHDVSVLTRAPKRAGDVAWDPRAPNAGWQAVVGTADVVVNLAGESIAGRRWTTARKAAILHSRIEASRALVNVIRAAPRPPTLISSSAIGIYGPRGDEPVTEDTEPGADFLAQVCTAWEHEALEAAAMTRVVLLRTGVVLAREGGALPQMALPFRLWAGGPVGSGRQYVSWVHIDDWTELARWAVLTSEVSGPLNVTAPQPVTNRELASTLGRVLQRPAIIPAPAFALRLVLGEMADIVLTGQRVLPARAQALGFAFQYPELEGALRSLYR